MRLPDATNSCYFCIEAIALSEIHFCKYQIHFPRHPIHFCKYQIHFQKHPIHLFHANTLSQIPNTLSKMPILQIYPIRLILLENMLFICRKDATRKFKCVWSCFSPPTLFCDPFFNLFEFNSNVDQEEVTQHQRVTLDAVSAFLRPSSHPSKMQAMKMVGFFCVSAQSLFFFLD